MTTQTTAQNNVVDFGPKPQTMEDLLIMTAEIAQNDVDEKIRAIINRDNENRQIIQNARNRLTAWFPILDPDNIYYYPVLSSPEKMIVFFAYVINDKFDPILFRVADKVETIELSAVDWQFRSDIFDYVDDPDESNPFSIMSVTYTNYKTQLTNLDMAEFLRVFSASYGKNTFANARKNYGLHLEKMANWENVKNDPDPLRYVKKSFSSSVMVNNTDHVTAAALSAIALTLDKLLLKFEENES